MNDMSMITTTDITVSPSITVEISPPIKHAGATYDAIQLREPTVGEVRRAEKNLTQFGGGDGLRLRDTWLVSYVSGVPFPVLEECPISVMNRCTTYLNAFFSLGREIGAS